MSVHGIFVHKTNYLSPKFLSSPVHSGCIVSPTPHHTRNVWVCDLMCKIILHKKASHCRWYWNYRTTVTKYYMYVSLSFLLLFFRCTQHRWWCTLEMEGKVEESFKGREIKYYNFIIFNIILCGWRHRKESLSTLLTLAVGCEETNLFMNRKSIYTNTKPHHHFPSFSPFFP